MNAFIKKCNFLVGQLVHSFLHPIEGFLKVKVAMCAELASVKLTLVYSSPKLSFLFISEVFLRTWFYPDLNM